MMFKTLSGPLALLATVASVVRADDPSNVDGSQYDDPNNGPPGSWFAGDSSLPASQIASAAAGCSQVPDDATYILGEGESDTATIYSDWSGFSKGAAYVFTADMDVDCDGLDYQCEGNPDGQPQTNFGALSAYEVPFVVIPDTFASDHPDELPGNNVVAVICNGRIFYGVFGDTDGDDPEEIGEASWLMANTCFPGEGLNGGAGHGSADVTYIFFTGGDAVVPSSALGDNYLTNFDTLRNLGDELMKDLVSNLNL